MANAALVALVVMLIGLEMWWGHRFLKLVRIALILILSFILLSGTTDLGPAARRALDRPQRVEIGPEGHKELAPEYASGVIVMKREAEEGLNDTVVPTAALALLALAPVLGMLRKPQSLGSGGRGAT